MAVVNAKADIQRFVRRNLLRLSLGLALLANYRLEQNPTHDASGLMTAVHVTLALLRIVPFMIFRRMFGLKDAMSPIKIRDVIFILSIKYTSLFGKAPAVRAGLDILIASQKAMLKLNGVPLSIQDVYLGTGPTSQRRDAIWVTRGKGHNCPIGTIPTIFYIHGGGYTVGTASMYLLTFNRLLKSLERHGIIAGVLSVEYPLAPEAPFPQGLEFVVKVYNDLVLNYKLLKPEHIVIAGDSAGGAMACAVVARVQEKMGSPPAIGVVLISPWVSHEVDSESHAAFQDIDIIGGGSLLRKYTKMYAQEHDGNHHEISVLSHPELIKLPRTLILAGEREVFVDDIRLFASHLEANGVQVELDVAPNMVHVYCCMSPFLGEPVQRAIDLMAGHCAKAFKSADHKLVPPL